MVYDNFDDQTTGEEPDGWYIYEVYPDECLAAVDDAVYVGSSGKSCRCEITRITNNYPDIVLLKENPSPIGLGKDIFEVSGHLRYNGKGDRSLADGVSIGAFYDVLSIGTGHSDKVLGQVYIGQDVNDVGIYFVYADPEGTAPGYTKITSGATPEANKWYFIRIYGNVKTEKYDFEIYSEETGELLHEKRDLPFRDTGTGYYAKYMGFELFGRAVDGSEAEKVKGYFDNMRLIWMYKGGIKTGTYSGDGEANGQQIDLGFRPKLVIIQYNRNSDSIWGYQFVAIDGAKGQRVMRHMARSNDSEHRWYDDMLTINDDGFLVKGPDADQCNKDDGEDSENYVYTAIG